jgi:DNA invertase Pin-like site-specific DNA recombinase
MKYLIYSRVSTDKQDTATQIRMMLEKLNQMHPDGKFTYVIYDEGDLSSGITILKRPQLQKMFAEMKKGDTVFVYLFDRLARDVLEMVGIHRDITKRGIAVLSLKDPYTDEFSVTIMGAIAQREREFISMKTKDKLETKKKNGERYSRFIPYGYGMHDTHRVPIREGNEIVYKPGILVEIQEEQNVIKRMIYYYSAGYSYRMICKLLQSDGLKNREGKAFQPMSISRIIKRQDSATFQVAHQEHTLCH